MKTTITFSGKNAEKAAQLVFTWVVDGGGEDILTELLSDNGISAANMHFDSDKKIITFDLE